MKKILIINKAHYGQHIDSYKYCKYLKNRLDVSYICFDFGFKKIEDETTVIYIKRQKNKIYGMLNFLREIVKEVNSNNYDVTFLVYFNFCFLLTFFSSINILDIRTGNISKNIFIVRVYNIMLLFESRFFKKITIISDNLRKYLLINKEKTSIVPLGAEKYEIEHKDYSTLRLMYIGTLSYRDIHITIDGLQNYILNTQDSNVKYDIFGDGRQQDILMLKRTIKKYSLQDVVTCHGRKPHNEIKDYFTKCNVGVSYIPIVDWYQNQPPTKTFEYLGAGMITLATKTNENKKIINHINGVLHLDNAISFSQALEYVKKNVVKYKSEEIVNSIKENNWQSIVDKHLLPVIKSSYNNE